MFKRKLLSLSLIFVSLMLVFHVPGCLEEEGTNKRGSEEGRVTLIIDFGAKNPSVSIPEHTVQEDGRIKWVFNNVSIAGNDTAFTVLIKVSGMWNFTVDYHYGTYGVFVDSVAGVRGSENSWWLYYIDGVLGDVAADRKVVEDGQEISWIYSSGE